MSDDRAQLEDGFTRLSNRMLDALLQARLTGAQLTVALAVARFTYGWNVKERPYNLQELLHVSGMVKQRFNPALKWLVDRHVILRRDGNIGFNTQVGEWELKSPGSRNPLPQSHGNRDPKVTHPVTAVVTHSVTEVVTDSVTTHIKEISKEAGPTGPASRANTPAPAYARARRDPEPASGGERSSSDNHARWQAILVNEYQWPIHVVKNPSYANGRVMRMLASWNRAALTEDELRAAITAAHRTRPRGEIDSPTFYRRFVDYEIRNRGAPRRRGGLSAVEQVEAANADLLGSEAEEGREIIDGSFTHVGRD